MADTPTGETVTPEAPSNGTGITTAPTQVNSSADVEAAKKEALQAELRARQLQNELDKIKADQDATRQKQLEEKEEFKTLYEQTQARLKEIEEADASRTRQAELSTATQEVLSEYDPKVVELAKISGLGLSDDSDAAKAVLKEKLDAFQKQVGVTPAPAGANNPRQTAPTEINRTELVTRNADGVSPMALAGAKGDESVIRNYIKAIPAIERMKEIARNGA